MSDTPQVPSIGRIVIFSDAASDPAKGTTRSAAVITHVWSATMVNLMVLPDMGTPVGKSSVQFGAPDLPYSWHWPPRT